MSDSSTPTDADGEKKDGGVGTDGTIPASTDGLAVGVSGDSHFNPEEDTPADSDS
ncbi:hypothetical protein [Rathayibacter iranicus]|uniref:Uncharacterized protein n=1 Tax=Rathayibacter iranicus NCPPB 2253 = VKM Ac-1602 TaxID=1328868 RepID=A0ABX5LG04_9MICO|nr:hypothetical protein [Rathayibacter iranicus]PWJ66702.1 hypothetical protein B0H03_101154 [Rathayibacter iranicus NCPPB 2253 = VKM Ac-1602]